jgi:hypothetical protein
LPIPLPQDVKARLKAITGDDAKAAEALVRDPRWCAAAGGEGCRHSPYHTLLLLPRHFIPPLQAVFKPAEISVRGKGVALALLGSLLLCGLRTGNRQLLNTVIAAIAVGDAV